MRKRAFCPRNTGGADAALAAFKGIPMGVSHFLPRGNSLWDLPMRLVYMESWSTGAGRPGVAPWQPLNPVKPHQKPPAPVTLWDYLAPNLSL